jgi:hypothetical protein
MKRILVLVLVLLLTAAITLPAAIPLFAEPGYTVTIQARFSIPPPPNPPNSEPLSVSITWSQTNSADSGESTTMFTIISAGGDVTVTAPDNCSKDGIEYRFARWTTVVLTTPPGQPVPYPPGQKTITFSVNSNKTAIANYVPVIYINPMGSETNVAGTQHTVWINAGIKIANIPIGFVIEGPNSAASGFAGTNGNGIATFTYTGSNTGTDKIWAYIDVNGNSQYDPPPSSTPPDIRTANTAVKIWVLANISVEARCNIGPPPLPTELLSVPVNWSAPVVSGTNSTTFGFMTANGTVSVTAPATAIKAGVYYNFTRWSTRIPGQGPVFFPLGQTNVSFLSDSDKIASANYTPVLYINPLTPSVNLVGEEHTVWVNTGIAAAGIPVGFVISGPNAGSSGFASTDATGIATFKYTGTGDGTDNIWAYIDVNNDKDYDQTGSPPDIRTNNTSVKSWVVNFLTGGGNLKVGKKVAWTFSGNLYALPEGGAAGHFTIVNHITRVTYLLDQIMVLFFYGNETQSPPASHNTVRFRATGTGNDGSLVTLVIIIEDADEPGAGSDRIAVEKIIVAPPYPQVADSWIGHIPFPPETGDPQLVTISGGNFQIHNVNGLEQ